MAFIRKQRKQFYLLEGIRDKRTKKVKQRLLYSLGKKLELPQKIADKYLTTENLERIKESSKEKFGEELIILEKK